MNHWHVSAAIPTAVLIALLSGCSSSQSTKSGSDVSLECVPADSPVSGSGYGLQPFCAPKAAIFDVF